MKKTCEDYPVGPCDLPLICSNCGATITDQNAIHQECDYECEICDYCGSGKCPVCLEHYHCGGCI